MYNMYVWQVFSTNFSSFFCTLKHEKNFKWPEKGPQPKELPEMFCPFAVFVFFIYFFLLNFFCLGFVLSKVWTSFFLCFWVAAKLFVNSKWVEASTVATVALQILWQPLRIRCFEPKCLLSLCSLLDETETDLRRRRFSLKILYFISL